MGTTKGLYLFDGVNWKKFSSEDGLEVTYIAALGLDLNGVLWICSGSKVCTYDGSRFRTVAALGEYMVEITTITFDEQNIAWVGTDNGIYTIGIDSTEAVAVRQYPAALTVRGNHPNPFNQGTFIDFDLSLRERITAGIYNCLGQRVRTLAECYLPAGSHTLRWDGMNDTGDELSSGVYFLRIHSGRMAATHRMTLLR